MNSLIASIAIVEEDTNDDVSLVWVFPGINSETRKILLQLSKDSDTFSYTCFNSEWIYMYNESVGSTSSVLPKVRKFTVAICSKIFNPEKYRHVLEMISGTYRTTGEPTKVLQAVLKLNTTGKFKSTLSDVKDFSISSYDDKHARLSGSSLKKVISCFGERAILIWLAVILKKRIFVLADRWADVLFVVRTLPQFAWLRQDWSVIRPQVRLRSQEQLNELKQSGVYIAGTVDTDISGTNDLFDILVDMKSQKIVVAEGAKSSMSPPSNLSDFATDMARKSKDSDCSETDLIKSIVMKTKELLSGLKKISGGNKVTTEAIQSKGIKGRFAVFLLNFALAEGLAN
eukprot:g7287.t1